jgi:hypothetical protein
LHTAGSFRFAEDTKTIKTGHGAHPAFEPAPHLLDYTTILLEQEFHTKSDGPFEKANMEQMFFCAL